MRSSCHEQVQTHCTHNHFIVKIITVHCSHQIQQWVEVEILLGGTLLDQ